MGIAWAPRGGAVVLGAVLAGRVLGLGGLASPVSAAAAVDATLLFHYADPQIDESSGLATSSYGDGIVYTFNDSGDTARFFAVNSSGETAAIYTLKGATNHDWEDMDTGTDANGNPVLYFGDIGDNAVRRTEVDVYQVPEPRGRSADVPWIRYRFQYPDGPHNAETLMVDPHTRRIFIASKAPIGEGLLYEAPAVLSTTAINTLAIVQPERSIPMLTTSGDISPDGKFMVLLTYFSAYWSVGVNGTLHAFPVKEQRQDEGIAFTRDGKSVIFDSEGVHLAVYQLPLPAEAIAADAAAGGASTLAPPVTPRPTPKPTPKATSRPSITTKTSPSPTTQTSSPVTPQLPTSSALNSFGAQAAAPPSSALDSAVPGPSQAASSGGRQLEATAILSTTKDQGSWLFWIVIAIVAFGIGAGVWLVLATRSRWWPWKLDTATRGRRR